MTLTSFCVSLYSLGCDPYLLILSSPSLSAGILVHITAMPDLCSVQD